MSTPGWIRTSNLRFRRPMLYPVELRVRPILERILGTVEEIRQRAARFARADAVPTLHGGSRRQRIGTVAAVVPPGGLCGSERLWFRQRF